VLPPEQGLSRLLVQQAGDFGNNTVPNLCDGALVERHKHRTHNYNNQYNDEPAGHLIAVLVHQCILGLHGRHLDFVFHCLKHSTYLRKFDFKRKREAAASHDIVPLSQD
jgi:hypothetical protein